MFGMPGTSYRRDLPPADEALSALAGELYQDVTHLAVDIGERNVQNHPRQLAQAADCIEAKFTAAGLAPQRRTYEVSGCTCCNLEVEIRGTARPEEIVIVGAHYDTVAGTAGANDNTSGVSATLALARRFAHCKTGRTLRFVAFVNEEKPYSHTEEMGSRVYARRCRERGEQVMAMLSLETIGYYDDAPGSQKYPPPFGLFYPATGNFIAFVGNLALCRSGSARGRSLQEKRTIPVRGCCIARAGAPHRRFGPCIVLARGIPGGNGYRHGKLPLSVLPHTGGHHRQSQFRPDGSGGAGSGKGS